MQATPLFLKAKLAAASLTCALLLAGCGVADTPPSLIAAGKEAVARKDYAAAVIRFKSALQLDAQSGEARYLLGNTLLKVSDPVGAALELSRALDQKYPTDLVLPPLARALLLTGDYKKLTQLYGDVNLQDKASQASLQASLAAAWGALGVQARTQAAIAASLAAVPDFGPGLILNARILAGKRDGEGALALVDKVLAADADMYEAWHLKGEILGYFKNDVAGSEAAFRKALAIEPAYMPAHLSLISARIVAQDLPGAKAQADKLRAVLPKHPQTMFVDAQLAFADNNLARARELTQQLLRFAPNHVGVLQLAGAIEGRSGSLVLAESQFSKALSINPDLPLARRNLAVVYLRLGQAAHALEVLQPLLRVDGGFADAHAAAGEAQLRLGNAEAAEEHFTRAAQIDPGNSRFQAAVALAQLRRGNPDDAFAQLESLAAGSRDTFTDQAIVSARLKRREFDLALKAVDAMGRKAPDTAAVADLRGRVQLLRKDYVAARLAFDEAVRLDPKLFAATANLAAIDLIEKKPEQAQKRLQSAVQADPRNYFASMALADLRTRAGAPVAEVKAVLSEAIKNSPGEPGPRLQLIQVALKKRQYKEALAAAQDAAAALPNNLQVLDAVGIAQMEAGDVEQALATFRRIAGVNDKSAQPYVRLADIYKASGKSAAAETALRKALEIEPGLGLAQEALVNQLLAGNRSREALEFARNMQRQQPAAASGYDFEALVQLKLKAPDAAVAALRKGLAVPGSNPALARTLYLTLLRAERGAEADRFGATWLKEHPEDVAFDYQMAVTAITRGDLDQAELRLRRVVDQRPAHPLALNNLAWVLASRNKPGGVEYAQRALDRVPDSAALMDTLAMALAVDKQFDKALSLQKRAVELLPLDKGMRLNLARIALQAGDKTLARTELEALRAAGPTQPYYKEVTTLMTKL